MTLHLLKLIWNRKGTNLLLMLEIFLSFIVLFAVTTLGLFYLDNWRQPLGYRWDDVWCVNVYYNLGMGGTRSGRGDLGFEGWTDEVAQTFRRLEEGLADFGELEATAAASSAPFEGVSWVSGYTVDGKWFPYQVDGVGDRFQDVLGCETVRGRFFSREDDGATFRPAVISERLARRVFGDQDPVGKLVPHDRHPGQPEMRVIGVVREYRPHGEFTASFDHVFVRYAGVTAFPASPPRLLLLKVRPGTPAAFEEKLLLRLQATAPDWSFTVKPLAEIRERNHRQLLAPMTAFALVAGFLLLMVAVGLTGVLWQNVTQRTREIGLRRAKGASARAIHGQILGELAVMTSLAVAAGTVVVVQFPLLDLLGFVRPGVFAESLAVSVATLYVVTLVCGLYPSRLATRLRPAEALRYE
jgi:putative ABC transport system permease protein